MLKNLLKLLFPSLCYGCNELLVQNENNICTSCNHDLPYTNHHNQLKNNTLNKFYGIVNLEFAFSMLYFHHDGVVQKLIHQLKYKGREEIGVFLGEKYAFELKNIKEQYKLDYIVPVPLHKKRLQKRGYNQIDSFCLTLSKELDIPYVTALLFRNQYSKTQTKKNKQERLDHIHEVFAVMDYTNYHGKHFLLVDDVITTGATIELCAKALLKIPNSKVSVITIAYTQS